MYELACRKLAEGKRERMVRSDSDRSTGAAAHQFELVLREVIVLAAAAATAAYIITVSSTPGAHWPTQPLHSTNAVQCAVQCASQFAAADPHHPPARAWSELELVWWGAAGQGRAGGRRRTHLSSGGLGTAPHAIHGSHPIFKTTNRPCLLPYPPNLFIPPPPSYRPQKKAVCSSSWVVFFFFFFPLPVYKEGVFFSVRFIARSLLPGISGTVRPVRSRSPEEKGQKKRKAASEGLFAGDVVSSLVRTKLSARHPPCPPFRDTNRPPHQTSQHFHHHPPVA